MTEPSSPSSSSTPPRPTLPGTRSAVNGRVVALEMRIVNLETRTHEQQRWIVAISSVLATFILLALLYAVRRFFT